MDCLAVKQAVKFAKEYALKKGPMVSLFTSCFLTQRIYSSNDRSLIGVVFFSDECSLHAGVGDGYL